MRQSGEDYLETILLLARRQGSVRSIDVAAELGYTKPSVSRAMSILREKGFITMDADRLIHLTDKGIAKAGEVYERHRLIARYFVLTLGVGEEQAAEDACRVEHVLSDEIVARIRSLVERAEGGKG